MSAPRRTPARWRWSKGKTARELWRGPELLASVWKGPRGWHWNIECGTGGTVGGAEFRQHEAEQAAKDAAP